MAITEEVCHVPRKIETVPGYHYRCDCGYVGTDTMIGFHVAQNGWCSECWGSGSDAYPSLGICRECRGTGEKG